MFKSILFAALIVATPLAASEIAKGAMLGHSMDEVKTSLEEMGYEVRKAEMEEGKIEVYFVKGTTKGEVYVDPDTGKITELKMK